MDTPKQHTPVDPKPIFKRISSKVDLPNLEKSILTLWEKRNVFRRTWTEREGQPLFILFEGPPTANGRPGIHHVLARVFKDVIPRYKTMNGFRPVRKGGWDTHGLPVELEVERELGISSKPEIEKLVPGNVESSIEDFNRRCRESVFRYVSEWETLTNRIGFWVDMQNAYLTMASSYIETAWWIFKQLWETGLIYQGVKGTPHCPRCVTSLSSHEVALGYREDTPDPSVFIKFRISKHFEGEQPAAYDILFPEGYTAAVSTSFLAWTTTPWTLPGNTALAVNGGAEYLVAEVAGEHLILAAALAEKVLQEGYREVARLPGQALVGLTYQPLYDPVEAGLEIRHFHTSKNSDGLTATRLESVDHFQNHVISEGFVSLEDGTGIVHIAPAFGDEDLNAGRLFNLHFLQPVTSEGELQGKLPGSGNFVKEADRPIMDDLELRGLLYKRGTYYHTYPFCWRCNSPLLYYAKNSWYIWTTAVKERLISGNEQINWYPEHIKKGRFGEWLRNNVDWAISRERYWGTPLPIWRCEACETLQCVGSLEELRAQASHGTEEYLQSTEPDLHRPFIDRVRLECNSCGGQMHRVPEVMDCWYDSGAMTLAQWHYPFENQNVISNGYYPANYICEAVDQTRGWFYSLHALAVLLEHSTNGTVTAPSYQNVVCLGLVLDGEGEKMSKSRGNVVDPWAILNAHGADALRWYLLTAAPPGNSRRFSAQLVEDVVRRFLLTLWNTYSFFVTYAELDGYTPNPTSSRAPTSELDRWVLSDLNELVKQVNELLEKYNPTDAARRIEDFVEVLSTWYVRRSRRRFWRSGNDLDKDAAYDTLYTCLVTLTKLLAPFVPFLAEELYQNLVCNVDPSAPDSVHLAVYPKPDQAVIDTELGEAMRLAMRLVSLGRAARSRVGLRVRQPLNSILVKTRSAVENQYVNLIANQMREELNVREVKLLDHDTRIVEYSLRPNLPVLGRKHGAALTQITAALAREDPEKITHQVQQGLQVQVGTFTLEPDEILIDVTDKVGFSSASDAGYMVAVATKVTPELRREGLAREIVHGLQNLRRAAGFEITDRIVSYCDGTNQIKEAIEDFADYVKGETLSMRLDLGPAPDGAQSQTIALDGVQVTLAVIKA